MLCWCSSNRLFLVLEGRGEVEEHPVAFQFRHQFHFSVLLQRLGELEQDEFSLFFVSDGTAAEVDVRFHLIAFFEELDRVLHLEVEVVIIRLGTKANLFDDLLALFGLKFLVFLFLLVKEFLVFDDSADRRIGGRYNFYQIQTNFLRDLQGILEGIDVGGDIVTYQTDFRSTDETVDLVLRLPLYRTTSAKEGPSPAAT